MNQLETVQIILARQHLAAVLEFYSANHDGTATKEDENEYCTNHKSLCELLALSHLDESDLSAEALQALRMIETEHAEAVQMLIDCREPGQQKEKLGHMIKR